MLYILERMGYRVKKLISKTHSCSCSVCAQHHEHVHNNELKENKFIANLIYIRLAAGAMLFTAGLLTQHRLWFCLISYIILGYDIFAGAILNIFRGKVFDENFLMTVASMGAFIIGEYPEAAAVMLFYQAGEMLQDKAVEKSRKSISELMDIRPDYANKVVGSKTERVSPQEIDVGDIILVSPGEKVPLDGVVVSGDTYIDTRALTGESIPVKAGCGDYVMSGSVNTISPIQIKVEKLFADSTVSKILDMVQYAQNKKAKSEKFITVFARYYTPIVVMLAMCIIIFPSIFTGDFSTWLYRGLVFLVVSCPCALVVSIPLGFFAGIGCASKNGILVKGGNYLEAMSKLDTVIFDKTGTLTKGEFKVVDIVTDHEKSYILKLAAYAEFYSNHPIAKSIKAAYGKDICADMISEYKEIAGKGIDTVIDGKHVKIGNELLINGISPEIVHGTVIHISENDIYLGYIVIDDVIKEDSKSAIEGLRKQNINTVMLTGDTKKSAEYAAKELGITKTYYQLLPQDKVRKTEEIINTKRKDKYVAFMGDGINDAPVLTIADIGIAMGGLGSDSAIEAADIVIMTDEPSKINTAIRISNRTMRIIIENIIFALAVKLIIMILSSFGMANMWMAIFGDVGVALLAILNSLRALKISGNKDKTFNI